jgi:hypothetical protein
MALITYRDRFVDLLFNDIAALIVDGSGDPHSIEARLLELTAANAPQVAEYWTRTRYGFGVPDTAFKDVSPYLFPQETPARVFCSSGTTGTERTAVCYTDRGLELKNLSVVTNVGRHILADLDRPVILGLVPPARCAPQMALAHEVDLIAETLGHRELSASVVTSQGVDFLLLADRVQAAIAEDLPVVLIGGSFAFVNVCDSLAAQRRSWSLPAGSWMVDGGGFKGRSRVVRVDELRAAVGQVFGIQPGHYQNMFGMTELASQLYDRTDVPVGPLGERPKGNSPFVQATVRDPDSPDYTEE